MSLNVGALNAGFEFDLSGLLSGIAEAESAISAFGSSMTEAFSSSSIIEGLENLQKQLAETSEQLTTVTSKVQSTAEQYQNLSTAAEEATTQISKLNSTAKNINVKASLTTGGTASSGGTGAVAAGVTGSAVATEAVAAEGKAAASTETQVKSLNSSFNTFGKDTSRIVGGILVSQAFYSIISSIKEASSSLFTFQQDMQKSQVAFTYLLGSAQKASSFITSMQSFAAKTPFDTEETLTMAQKLLAAGFAAKDVKSTMTTLVDAASASGGTTDQLDRIVLAMSEIKTTGTLSARQLRQFADAGIPAYTILEEKLHLTAKQMENIGNLKIPADTAINAIMSGLNERYGGAAAKISNTMAGMLDTIKDDATIVGSSMFDSFYTSLTGLVTVVRDKLDAIRLEVNQFGSAGVFKALVPTDLQVSVQAIFSDIGKLFSSISSVISAVGAIVSPTIGAMVVALAAVLQVVTPIIQAVSQLLVILLQTNPVVKAFVSAITAMLIAKSVTALLTLLWKVVGLGSICTKIAGCVTDLFKAIQTLVVFMAANPELTVILALAAALLYAAYCAGLFDGALSTLKNKLAEIFGGTTVAATSATDSTKSYNDTINSINKSLSNTGTTAAKSAKEVSKFAASFDELFQIPDKTDDATAATGALGNSLPTTGTTPTSGTNPTSSDDTTKKTTPVVGVPSNNSPPTPTIKPPSAPDFSAVLTAVAEFQAKWDAAWAKAQSTVTAWVPQVEKLLNPFTAFNAILTALTSLQLSWDTVFSGLTAPATLWNVTMTALFAPFATITAPILTAISTLQATWDLIFNSLGSPATLWNAAMTALFAPFATVLAPILSALSALQKTWDLDFPAMNVIATNWKSAMTTLFAPFAAVFTPVLSALAALKKVWEADFPAMTSVTTKWKSDQTTLLNPFTVFAIATSALAAFKKVWDTDFPAMTTITTSWKTNQTSLLNPFTVFNAATSALAAFKKAWDTDFPAMTSLVTAWKTTNVANVEAFSSAAEKSLNNFVTTQKANFKSFVTVTAGNVYNWCANVFANIQAMNVAASSIMAKGLGNMAGNVATFVTSIADTVATWAQNFVNTLVSAWNAVASFIGQHPVESVIIAHVAMVVGALALTAVTGGAALPLVGLAAAETGGFVDRDQLIRVGEHNKKEAIVPLQNQTAMAPFADAVAATLATKNTTSTSSSSDSRTPIYVGTLIADEAGYKMLERKLKIIRLQEAQRTGGN
jgi:tape measure domain-containing protein